MNKICDNGVCSLRIKNLCKNYDTVCAIQNVSFETKLGEIIAILGPNGAGKSTLMNMIAGYLAPTSGEIYVENNDISVDDMKTKKSIGFLSEGAPLYVDMTVKLFLKYMIELKLDVDNEDSAKRKEIYDEELNRIVEIANISNVLNQKIDTLSKGYVRRVGFAQSIIGNPPILLLDEPTDGLDPNQKDYMKDLIIDMGKGKTILISTHLLDEAQTIANRIILINHGKIVADGKLKDILKKTKTSSMEDAFRALTK